MKLIHCPLNGPRNQSEFIYGGELHLQPDAASCDAKAWARYVFFHDNPAGNVVEWWCHAPSSYWFLAERNTVTDEFVRTFTAAEFFDGLNQGSAG